MREGRYVSAKVSILIRVQPGNHPSLFKVCQQPSAAVSPLRFLVRVGVSSPCVLRFPKKHVQNAIYPYVLCFLGCKRSHTRYAR